MAKRKVPAKKKAAKKAVKPGTPERVIHIRCDPEMQQDRVRLDELEDFQGELKTLSEAAAGEFRQNLLSLGYSFPTCVWHGHKLILDGHQRNKVLRDLLAEGYTLIDVDGVSTVSVPVSWIMADSEQEARQKVLAAVSQYGKVSDQGLANFLGAADLEWAEVDAWVDLPDFDAEAFAEGFFGDVPVAEDPDLSSGSSDNAVMIQLVGDGESFTADFMDRLHKMCQGASISVHGDDTSRPVRRYWGSWKKGDVSQPTEDSA